MGVLRTLNVAPSQLHPNKWASLQFFHLMFDLLRLRPTPSTDLHYYTSALLKFLSRPRVGSSFFMSSISPNFLCIGPRPLPASSSGLVRSLVPRNRRFATCLIASRGGCLPARSCQYISRPRGGLIFSVCLYSLLL